MRNKRVGNLLYANYELPISLNMGKVHTGNRPSTVPEALVVGGRYGVGVDEDTDNAMKEFIDALNVVVQADPWLKEYPPKMEWWGGQFKPAHISVSDPIIETLASAYNDTTGRSPVLEGVTFGSDKRHLVNVGETTTILFGPGDIRGSHKPNEAVYIKDLDDSQDTCIVNPSILWALTGV